MGDVVELEVETTLPIPAAKLLQKAIEGDLTDVIIIGYDPEGQLWLSTSNPDVPHVFWMMELARRHLLDAYAPETPPPDRAA